jgi:hypothetical protein
MQTAIIQTRYLPEREKLIVIVKDGLLKVFEPFKDMQMSKQALLMWPDICALEMK